MLDDTREEIEVEDEQLRQLLRMHEALLSKCQTSTPDPIELSYTFHFK